MFYLTRNLRVQRYIHIFDTAYSMLQYYTSPRKQVTHTLLKAHWDILNATKTTQLQDAYVKVSNR